jgi:hypothetical protein
MQHPGDRPRFRGFRRSTAGGAVIRRALVCVVTLMLVIPVLADARSGGPRVPSAQLQASGSGAMTVSGRLAVAGTIPQNGQVVVIDRRGDAMAFLAGEPLTFRRGRATVRRAEGILFVTGGSVSVQVLGVDLSFSIAGNGQARLTGSGSYRLNGGPARDWGRGTIKVSPSSSSERRGDRGCGDCRAPVSRRR